SVTFGACGLDFYFTVISTTARRRGSSRNCGRISLVAGPELWRYAEKPPALPHLNQTKTKPKSMPSIPYPYFSKLALIAVMSVLLSGCGGVTLSPVKRKPLQVSPLETSLRPNPQKVLVRFESTLAGQPLAETVWDNKSGAFADAAE